MMSIQRRKSHWPIFVEHAAGQIELHDIKRKTRRVIYTDDPQ
jgi:hypothetical protein